MIVFCNLGGHATWDSKFYGVTYACKVLGYNKRESIFVDSFGSVKKITGRYLFLFQPCQEHAPCQRRCVRAQFSLKEDGWGPPAVREALQDGVQIESILVSASSLFKSVVIFRQVVFISNLLCGQCVGQTKFESASCTSINVHSAVIVKAGYIFMIDTM